VTREVFECFAALYHLQVRGGQTLFCVVLEHRLQLPDVLLRLTSHSRPTHGLRLVDALSTDVHNVVLDFLRAERSWLCPFTLRFIRTDRIGRLQIEAGIK